MNPHHHRSTLFPVCKSYAFITRLVFLILGTALILSAIPAQAAEDSIRILSLNTWVDRFKANTSVMSEFFINGNYDIHWLERFMAGGGDQRRAG